MINTHSLDLEKASIQYVYIADGDQAGLDFAGDLTFELWLNVETLPSTDNWYPRIINKYVGGGAPDQAYEWVFWNDDYVFFQYYDAGLDETDCRSDAAAIVAGDVGNWVHLAVSIDVSVPLIKFYKQGSPIASTMGSTFATSIRNGGEPFRIGRGSSDLSIIDGKVDDIRAWSDVRSDAEIYDNFQKELVGNEANLEGYWKLNNGYTDETTNNNDLTAVGSPVFSTDVPFVTFRKHLMCY